MNQSLSISVVKTNGSTIIVERPILIEEEWPEMPEEEATTKKSRRWKLFSGKGRKGKKGFKRLNSENSIEESDESNSSISTSKHSLEDADFSSEPAPEVPMPERKSRGREVSV